MEAEKLAVFVCDLAYGVSSWGLPQSDSVLRIRTESINTLWHKENLINLTVEALPLEFDVIAWIDPDIWFQRREWYQAACTALEEHCVVQLFDSVALTGEDGRLTTRMDGAAARGEIALGQTTPGYAWAARRSLWTEGGGLYDRAIIGGGDAVNASVWLPCAKGTLESLRYPNLDSGLTRQREWFEREGGSCGFIEGTIWHEWHGDVKNRQYLQRHKLVEGFDFDKGLVYRDDGLLEFAPHVSPAFRKSIALYFEQRQEDGDSGRSKSERGPDHGINLRTRSDLINALAIRTGAERYLEIGLRNPAHNFDHIDIEEKESVDPDPNAGAHYQGTSDAFFETVASLSGAERKEWDIIFIDGMHTAEQVYRDIYHGLMHLADGGFLVVHDCNPEDEWRTRSFEAFQKDAGPWNGTVYQAITYLCKVDPELECVVVDMDDGCGVIRRRSRPDGVPELPAGVFEREEFNFQAFSADRAKSIHLVSREEFIRKYLLDASEVQEIEEAESETAELRVTALLLNWKRPANFPLVIESIRKQSIPVSIWIWDNSGTLGSGEDFGADVVIRSSKNLLFWPRWMMAALSQTDYVFSLDDDLRLTDPELIQNCVSYMETTEHEVDSLMLGRTGVVLDSEKGYTQSTHVSAAAEQPSSAPPAPELEVNILKGQFLFMSREFLEAVPMKPEDDDDIRMSAAAKRCIIPPFMYGAFENLPDHDGLCEQSGHFERRNRAAQRYFRQVDSEKAIAQPASQLPEGIHSQHGKVWTYWEDVGQSPGYMGKLFECMRHHLGDRLIIADEKSIYDFLPKEEIDREWGFTHQHWSPHDWVVHKAEHIRLALVYYHGGIWIDADSIVFDHFDPWFDKLDEAGLIFRSEQLFGATPRHPFIGECLDLHRERQFGTWGNPGGLKRFLEPDFPHLFYGIPPEEHESKLGPSWRDSCSAKVSEACASRSVPEISDVIHDQQRYLTINSQSRQSEIKAMPEAEFMASGSLLASLIQHSLARDTEPTTYDVEFGAG